MVASAESVMYRTSDNLMALSPQVGAGAGMHPSHTLSTPSSAPLTSPAMMMCTAWGMFVQTMILSVHHWLFFASLWGLRGQGALEHPLTHLACMCVCAVYVCLHACICKHTHMHHLPMHMHMHMHTLIVATLPLFISMPANQLVLTVATLLCGTRRWSTASPPNLQTRAALLIWKRWLPTAAAQAALCCVGVQCHVTL